MFNSDIKMNNILKDIEETYSNEILNLKMNDQFIWPVVRYSIRNYLFSKNNRSENIGLTSTSSSKIKKLRIGFQFIWQIFHNRKYKISNYDYIILECIERSDDEFGDIHTYSIRKYLDNYSIFLRPSTKRCINKKPNDSNIYNISLGYIIYLLKSVLFKKFHLYPSIKLIEVICTNYGINKDYIYSDIIKYFIFYKYYDKLLNKISPKKLFLYAGYNITNLALIKSAKEKKIKTYEIQHGNFTEHDNNYHFFHEDFKEFDLYFADTFLCFNKKFKDSLNKRNSYFYNKNIIEIGFPITHLLRKIEDGNSNKIKVVVIPTVYLDQNFKSVVSNLLNLMDENKYIEVAIRFHPKVINKDIIEYVKNQYGDKVEVDSRPWKESILWYDYFIGEYSTTLLEAEYIGKRVFLINTQNAKKSESIMVDPKYLKDFSKNTFIPYNWDFSDVIKKKKSIEKFIEIDKTQQ